MPRLGFCVRNELVFAFGDLDAAKAAAALPPARTRNANLSSTGKLEDGLAKFTLDDLGYGQIGRPEGQLRHQSGG